MKKLILFVMAMVFCMTFTITAFASQPNIRFNRNAIELSTQSENVRGYTMVEARELFGLLGADVTISNDLRNISATKGDISVNLTVGSVDAIIGGRLQTLPVAPYRSGENVMVPLAALSTAFGASVLWDGATRTIDIRLNEFDVADAEFTFLEKNRFATNSSTVMSHEAVLRAAITANRQIETLSERLSDLSVWLDDVEDNLRDANDALWRTRDGLWDARAAAGVAIATGTDVGAFFAIERDLLATEASLVQAIADMASREIEGRNQLRSRAEMEQLIADAAELMVLTYLTNINNHAMDLQLMESAVIQSERNRDFVRLRRDLGMASDEDLRTAELALRQDRAAVTALTSVLQTERENLNRLLRFPITRDLVVTFEPEIVPVEVADINAFIRQATADDVNIRNNRVSVEAAEAALSSARNLGRSSFTTEREWQDWGRTIENYERTLRNARDAYRTAAENLDRNIRSTYNSLKQLEERRDILISDLARANNNYRIATANYEIGNITQFELDAARMAVLQAEIAIVKNIFQHNMLRFTFERTYLLSM